MWPFSTIATNSQRMKAIKDREPTLTGPAWIQQQCKLQSEGRMQKPCLLEKGGYFPNSKVGYAIIIGNKDGQPKHAERLIAHCRPNGPSAVIPLANGDHIVALRIKESRVTEGYILKVTGFNRQNSNVLSGKSECIGRYDPATNEWVVIPDSTPNEVCSKLIIAALERASIQRCRWSTYTI